MPASTAANPGDLYGAAFRRCLEEVDVAGMRKLHAHVMPHLPAGSDKDILVSIHHARTQAESMPLKARAWSHRWLLDHGYPSGLPDHLKPSAEREYPRITEATGFTMRFGSPLMREILSPIVPLVSKAVEEVILDEYSGAVVRRDHDRIRGRVLDAKAKAVRQLVGIK